MQNASTSARAKARDYIRMAHDAKTCHHKEACFPMKLRVTLWLLACAVLCIPARAADKPGTMPLNKLTVSYYHFSSGKDGVDLNLRHTFKSSTAWIGGYHESDGFDQLRLGYEYDYH